MPPYANGWFHLATTYPGGDNAADVKIYVNGSEVSSYVALQNGLGAYMSDSGLSARIGRSSYENYAAANFDDVRIYNRALSADEVAELYRLGTRKVEVKQ